MNLKGQLKKIAKTVISEAGLGSEAFDNGVNSLLEKMGKYSGQKTTEEYIQKAKNNYLIIQSHSFSLGTMAGVIMGKPPKIDDLLGRYRVIDKEGNVKYTSDAACNLTNRDILSVYNATGEKLGHVKEWLYSPHIPLFEKDSITCTVKLGKETICVLQKAESFGEVDLNVIDGDLEIYHKNGENIRINYKGKNILKINEMPLKLANGYADKYLIEFTNPDDELLCVLLTIAIDTINV